MYSVVVRYSTSGRCMYDSAVVDVVSRKFFGGEREIREGRDAARISTSARVLSGRGHIFARGTHTM